jgi:hypothetical protein
LMTNHSNGGAVNLKSQVRSENKKKELQGMLSPDYPVAFHDLFYI